MPFLVREITAKPHSPDLFISVTLQSFSVTFLYRYCHPITTSWSVTLEQVWCELIINCLFLICSWLSHCSLDLHMGTVPRPLFLNSQAAPSKMRVTYRNPHGRTFVSKRVIASYVFDWVIIVWVLRMRDIRNDSNMFTVLLDFYAMGSIRSLLITILSLYSTSPFQTPWSPNSFLHKA